ncbi:hypothetical protein HXZ76_06730 [Acinetobacter indicus]|uniref:hypothetical protein n=1 Tax=Acinetobacter indicus TaxID=756892 RepID=UPI00257666DA|nr:hypothetical protein [Acinetobacter indicus]MDM1304002.1 hypothetical protein [Acinetobacter indicus]
MTNTIDGFNFDLPLRAEQIIELAHHHRKKLDEAVFHQDIHLGEYCLAQRKRVHDFTSTLDPQQREEFYRIYNGELISIADDDELHPADAEKGVSIFAIFIVLAIVAGIILYTVFRALMT